MSVRLGCFDLETTSLDPAKGHVVELGFVVKDFGEVRPLVVKSEYIYEPHYGTNFIPEEAKKIHLIADTIAEQFGRPLRKVMAEVAEICKKHRVDYLVGHNCNRFDVPYLKYHTEGMDFLEDFWKLPVIDTQFDIDYPHNKTRKLEFLCAMEGFLNPYAHIAFGDCLTTLRLLDNYDIDKVIENAKSPKLTIRAMVDYDNKHKARAKGYFWDRDKKQWLKHVREKDLDKEMAVDFQVVKVS